MKAFMIAVAILGILCPKAHSQEITLKKENLTNFNANSIFKLPQQKGFTFSLDNEHFESIGYKGSEIEKYLRKNSDSATEFSKYRKKLGASKILFYTSLGLGASALVLIANNPSGDRDKYLIGSLVGLQLGTAITSLIFQRTAPRHLENAVVMYNSGFD